MYEASRDLSATAELLVRDSVGLYRRVVFYKFTDITVMFVSRDSLYYAYIISPPNAMACVSKYRRLVLVHRDYIPEPAVTVDHFAGSGARRLHFVF